MERAGFRTAATIADGWRAERGERLKRTALDRADFAALADGGYLDLAVPIDQGGSLDESGGVDPRHRRRRCATLAAGDASPALVAAMHPAVLSFWLANPVDGADEWEAQRRAVFATAADGAQWGTVTSEPGSGGDVARTRTVARAGGRRRGRRRGPGSALPPQRRQALRQRHRRVLLHDHHRRARRRGRGQRLLPRHARPHDRRPPGRLHRRRRVGRHRHGGDAEPRRPPRRLSRHPPRVPGPVRRAAVRRRTGEPGRVHRGRPRDRRRGDGRRLGAPRPPSRPTSAPTSRSSGPGPRPSTG